MAELRESTLAAFSETFGGPAAVLGQAPGRVELLGNHTDYHNGLVMSAAIDRYTVVAGWPVQGRQARVWSVAIGQIDEFELGPGEKAEEGIWANYIRGVLWSLQKGHGALRQGFDAAIAGDVPLGGGLSSSASLEAAMAMFLLRAGLVPGASANLDDAARMALAQELRRAENDFVGVASGLLDQFSSLFGKANHALVLDCKSLDFQRVPMGNPAPAIVVCDSKTSRRLADGMYNRRRAEGERVVTYFQEKKGTAAVQSLREVTLEEFDAAWDHLDPVGRRRARHVLNENERVRRGAEALRRGDVETFGRLMSESHASSRDDFENSSPALNALIEAAEVAPGFLGGKLCGAGWAGCTANLVRADQAEAFAESVQATYHRRIGTVAHVSICHAAEGASSELLHGYERS